MTRNQLVPSTSSADIQEPPSKKAKLFDFMNVRPPKPSVLPSQDDISQQFDLIKPDADVCGRGLEVFNELRFCSLKPLARQLFCVPASSAASERVFSQAGLVMRPSRSRLSKETVRKLVFLKCNEHLR
jgi:hypothetical protein